MKIIGAGLAGLLTANVLRKHDPIIYEKQNKIPENHNAVLRHRNIKLSDATSIPFKKVTVYKQIYFDGGFVPPDIKLANLYSKKVVGEFQNRSIMNMENETRFIAPKTFVQQLSVGCEIKYNAEIKDLRAFVEESKEPVISTIPIMVMASALGYGELLKEINFSYSPVLVVRAQIKNCDLYQTVYYPSEKDLPYRISITGDVAIMEICDPDHSHERIMDEVFLHNLLASYLKNQFGISLPDLNPLDVTTMKFGKINKIADQTALKNIIGSMTKLHNVYSVGRFAIWRNVLLEDVLDDIYIVRNLIEARGYYTGKK